MSFTAPGTRITRERNSFSGAMEIVRNGRTSLRPASASRPAFSFRHGAWCCSANPPSVDNANLDARAGLFHPDSRPGLGRPVQYRRTIQVHFVDAHTVNGSNFRELTSGRDVHVGSLHDQSVCYMSCAAEFSGYAGLAAHPAGDSAVRVPPCVWSRRVRL